MSLDLEALLQGHKTVAAKIRALAAAGVPRAEIARMLGKRYQHVRNVLEEPGSTKAVDGPAAPGMAEGDIGFFVHDNPKTYRLEARNGAVTLPPEVFEALGASPNGVIIAELGQETFTMISTMEGIRRIQAWTRTFPPSDKLASEELIEERRREAALDDLEAQTWAERRRRDD
jgi:predicted transcriptional regulator